MDTSTFRPTREQIEAMAARQRQAREAAQARVRQAQRDKERAEADARAAMLVEYHLYRAAALEAGSAKFDRFEEAYLRWQSGLRSDAVSVHPTMFDTEKVYHLVRFLAGRDLMPREGFDPQALRLEFPNWVDDLTLIPTDGSIRSALRALAMRRTGIRELDQASGRYVYVPEQDAQPRFRRKSSNDAEESDPQP